MLPRWKMGATTSLRLIERSECGGVRVRSLTMFVRTEQPEAVFRVGTGRNEKKMRREISLR
jgi:hypothetical protein